MKLLLVVLSAAIGYLLGSISFARVIARLFAPATDISRIEQAIPNSDMVFVSDSVSATAVRVHVGTRYGCLTAILDMLKVAIPTWAVKHRSSETPYHLIVASAGVIGHNWPLYHDFKGGRGESPILGGMLIIDWFGVLVTNLVGWPIGILSGNLLVLRWAGLLLLVPWLWLRNRDWPHLAYGLGVNGLYWMAMRPELSQYFDLRDKGDEPSQEELAELLGMGGALGRIIDQYNLAALLERPADCGHAEDHAR